MKDKAIVNEIEELNSFKLLSKAYTEIASIRMKKTRDSVVKNREFLTRLNDVFSDVRASYAREVLLLGTRKAREEKITFLAHNGKTVGVFLAANTGLYGDIIERTFELFLKEIRGSDIEVVIVGRLGLDYFQQVEPDRPFTYFDLSDKEIDASNLAQIIRHLVQYEEIRVYYPSFHSAVSQRPTIYKISAETPIQEIREKTKGKTSYLFEPSLKEILIFFEEEVFASLLDQAIRDAQLAKFAARVLALDRAGENIKRELKKLELERLRVGHKLANKKQQERLASIVN